MVVFIYNLGGKKLFPQETQNPESTQEYKFNDIKLFKQLGVREVRNGNKIKNSHDHGKMEGNGKQALQSKKANFLLPSKSS